MDQKHPIMEQEHLCPIMMEFNKINKKLSDALGYVDPTKGWAVTINPNKWFGDPAYGEENGQFANGIMTGQMTYRTDGDSGKLSSDKNCPKHSHY